MLRALVARVPDYAPGLVGEDERLGWARRRLWRLVVPALMSVLPLLSAQYGPYLSIVLVLATHFPTPRSFRESVQASQTDGR